MKKSDTWTADWGTDGGTGPLAVLNAIQHPVIMIDGEGNLAFANWEAESFFGASAAHLAKQNIETLVPFGSPLVALIDQVRERHAPINEYKVDLSSPRLGYDKLVDLYAAPLVGGPADHVVIILQERSMADKIDRQLTHRGAARSVTGLAAMLAHEIKNPLSGIRGAAQLLESSVGDEDRSLARLIRDETDRIVSLVDRMEIFSDERPVDRAPINIHSVLDHVKSLAQAGFARKIKFTELYDPSLPPVYANRDQLVQVFLNLVKNAAEAIGDSADHGVIDPYHRVYHYPTLSVVDGAAISANLGVNPSLSITAQAERAAALWPNKGEQDLRPAQGEAYRRLTPIAPAHPVVPADAPAALRNLPIEPVSQASANQRKGRCGRVAEGVCIRLYSEEDFLSRPEFTEPEIQRTNLASVILSMLSLKLGDVFDFPFVDAPDARFVKDGYRLLFELGAVDDAERITGLGRQLSRLPIDPRLARMVLARAGAADRRNQVGFRQLEKNPEELATANAHIRVVLDRS